MNAHALAVAIYGNPNTTQKSTRSAEYDVIARVTSRLRKAHLGGKKAYPALAEALVENSRLWAALAVDLADPENALSMALRGQLLSLAQFTLQQTDKILEGRESAEVLIEINTAVLRGLSGKAEPA